MTSVFTLKYDGIFNGATRCRTYISTEEDKMAIFEFRECDKKIKLTDTAYREIREFTKPELEDYLNNIYFDAHNEEIDYIRMYTEISKVAGVDRERLDEIMDIIKNVLDNRMLTECFYSSICNCDDFDFDFGDE